MINGKSILAIIPARGGSKGIPRKNVCMLAGKPLIAWTIDEAMKSKYIDRLILSSEDAEIIKVAKEWGCEVPFIRPSELAQDDTPGISPVLHAMANIAEKYDYITVLQPTSPLRVVEDIDQCITICLKQNAPACVSVTETEKPPYWIYSINEYGRLVPLIQSEKNIASRQESKQFFVLNGAMYMSEINQLYQYSTFLTSETIAYVMPKYRSADIDTVFDLKICDFLLTQRESENVTE